MSEFQVINLGSDDPTLIRQNVQQDIEDGIVKYGIQDEQFQYLLDMFVNSPTHNAIVNAVSLLIYGKGLNIEGLINPKELRKVCFDFYIFGNFAIQLVDGKMMHIPVNYLRAKEVNEKGKIEGYFYSTDWLSGDLDPQYIPSFESNPTAKLSIFYGRPYTPNAFYYNLPTFQGGLPYAELEIEIAKFLNNNVQNKFSVLKKISFTNGVPDEESRRKQVSQIKKKLTGATGDQILVEFVADKDHAAEITDISIDNAAGQYEYVSKEAQEKLIVAHSITSPLLLGIRDTSGFSSNAEEMNSAKEVFHEMKIKPLQEFIADSLNQIAGRDDIHFITVEETAQNTEVAKAELKAQIKEDVESEIALEEFLACGEDSVDGYSLLESAEVDYDLEDEMDNILTDHFKPTKLEAMAQGLVNLVSTGKASPKTKSSQDTAEYVVRYKYTRGGAPNKDGNEDRAFCTAMTKADKLYRKEDIQAMERRPVNPGFGEKGKRTYDIFLYKGGARCRHKWFREVYLRKDVSDKSRIALGDRISSARAKKMGGLKTNDPKVSVVPNDMKHKGFVTKATMPKDAKAKTTGI